MTSNLLRVASALAAGALLLPGAADAKNDKDKGRGNGHGHGRPAWAGPKAAPAPQPGSRRAATDTVVADPAPEAPGLETPAPVTEPAPVIQAPVAPAPKRHGRSKPKTFVFQGRVLAVDAEAGTADVLVRKGNSRGRRFRGEVVTFSLATARIDADEADGAAGITLGDVLAGDRVVIHALLPQSASPDGSVVTARKLVDLTEREDAPADGEPTPDTPPVVDPAPEAPGPDAPAV